MFCGVDTLSFARGIGGGVTAIARFAVPTFFAISGRFYVSKSELRRNGRAVKAIKKASSYYKLYLLFCLFWVIIFVILEKSPYRELARWAKISITPSNIFRMLFMGVALGNEYLWYMHAIAIVFLIIAVCERFDLFQFLLRKPVVYTLIALFWFVSEGISLIFDKAAPYWLYRNGAIEGLAFFILGMYVKKHPFYIGKLHLIIMYICGLVLPVIEYLTIGRREFYFGCLILVFAILSGEPIMSVSHVRVNLLSRIAQKYGLQLYLYHALVSLLYSFLVTYVFSPNAMYDWLFPFVVAVGTVFLVQNSLMQKFDMKMLRMCGMK